MADSKTCPRCKETKLFQEFYKRAASPDGLSSSCKTCAKKASKIYREEKSDFIKESKHAYYEANREKILEKSRKYTEENRETIRERQQKAYYDNRDTILKKRRERDSKNRERIREQRRNYYWRNRERVCALEKQKRKRRSSQIREQNARRKAWKIKATPTWLSRQHIKEIRLMYSLAENLAANTGISYHVDHMHPLKGENLCGLHVPWNLRVIPARENLQKNNRFNPALGLTAT